MGSMHTPEPVELVVTTPATLDEAATSLADTDTITLTLGSGETVTFTFRVRHDYVDTYTLEGRAELTSGVVWARVEQRSQDDKTLILRYVG